MLDQLSHKFQDAFKKISGNSKISEKNIEDALQEIRQALLEADVHFKVVKDFIQETKTEALGEKVLRGVNPGQQFIKIVHDRLIEVMGGNLPAPEYKQSFQVFLIVGLNGAGKTTFSGKLALWLKNKQKKDIYLIPADNFRPAAKEQLIKHARGMQIEYFDSNLSQSVPQIIHAGLEEAKKLKKEFVIIDTAGRLQVDEALMDELVQAKKTAQTHAPNLETVLVADAMTGQEAIHVASAFHQKVQLTSVALSKMDSDARGGAALSIRAVTGVPIRFVSVGEKMKDLELFYPDRLAKRILDMGDVVGLVEKAQEGIDQDEAERLMKRLKAKEFSITDFVKQLDQINRLGSMTSILKMIPGMGSMLRQVGDLSAGEAKMNEMRVLINSMTAKERDLPSLLSQESRIQRIARGSGKTVADVKDFLTKFKQMRDMMFQFSQMMNGGGLPSLPGMGPVKGFRQSKGQPQNFGTAGNENKDKGAKKSPFGKKYF